MKNFREHILYSGSTIKQALIQLDILAKDAILFIVNHENKLIGALTDGDVRRGLLRGMSIDDTVDSIIQRNPKFIKRGDCDVDKVIEYRDGNFKILPVIDKDNKVVKLINFRKIRSYLPIDAVIMAGGRGQRLQPFTDVTPKPLLKVGDRAIIDYNIDRLTLYGVDNFWISVNYLGEQIESHFGDWEHNNIHFNFVWEDEPLGTIGAVSKITNFSHDYILIMNSDILTNLDYEHFFLDFINQDADFSVVTIPYKLSVPYAVLDTTNGKINSLKEKPTYTYYSNGGIYLMKKALLDVLPYNSHFNATDMIEKLLEENKKVVSYPHLGYWLDIGKHEDFEKAQMDIKHIKF